MKINRKTHLELRVQNLLFTLLFLVLVGLLAWLSTRYSAEFDVTANGRHTLSEASRKVLDLLKGPVTVTAYARETPATRQKIKDDIGRYSRHKSDLTLTFENPDTQPDKVRELNITMDGEMIIAYQGKTEKLAETSENAVTNALQRLAMAKERRVVFLEGHGDRNPQGQANHDLGQFGEELKRKGVGLSLINLAVTQAVPDNTDVLVIAGPHVKLLPGEVSLIKGYVKNGGNLLWLADPGDLFGLAPLAEDLGIRFLPGTVVDASTQMFGIDDPTFALVAEYPRHPVTTDFHSMTVFPSAAALEKADGGDFKSEPILSTLDRSWTETGPVSGKIKHDPDKGEKAGPLTIGVALTRTVSTPTPATADNIKTAASEAAKSRQQRIVVIGDGDFLANAYLGNGGNIDLGLNLIHWLSQNEDFISIPAKTAADQKLELSEAASGLIGVGFLILLPLALFGGGALIWFKRRSR